MRYPFEASVDELTADLGEYVESVTASLESDFLSPPRGEGFIEYPTFEHGYEALKKATDGFQHLDASTILAVVYEKPIALIVLRAMLGFTPPEWAYVASQRTGIVVGQAAARSIDRKIRLAPERPISKAATATAKRVEALVTTGCELLIAGAPPVLSERIHRLDKADTKEGLAGLRGAASIGVPYAMLLYERFLGRPFAGHRDSVSELIGDELELMIEQTLHNAGITYRKTKRAEKVQGMDQAPDFIVPDEFNPEVVIEAKITEDDGTARDKITRVQHLASMSEARTANGGNSFEVIACVGGRGFGVRRSDIRKLLLATRGKVFTRQTMNKLVDNTRLQGFRTKPSS